MKHRAGYLALTIAWIGGMAAGGLAGYLAMNVTSSNNTFEDLLVTLWVILVTAICALAGGIIAFVVALIAGGYGYVLKTLLIMTIATIVIITAALYSWFPHLVAALLFVPLIARFLALPRHQVIVETPSTAPKPPVIK